MCRRKTSAMKTIEAMCSAQNVAPAELAAKSRMLLESYRSVCWSTLGICRTESNDSYGICDNSIAQALDYLSTYESTVDKNNFQKKLRTLFDSLWMIELVDDTMIKVKEFPINGNLYFDIICNFYLSKYKLCESDLLEVLKIERSCYYDRKKEAILVFGLAFWGSVLPRLSTILHEKSLKN